MPLMARTVAAREKCSVPGVTMVSPWGLVALAGDLCDGLAPA